MTLETQTKEQVLANFLNCDVSDIYRQIMSDDYFEHGKQEYLVLLKNEINANDIRNIPFDEVNGYYIYRTE